jgi:hypothetical protein
MQMEHSPSSSSFTRFELPPLEVLRFTEGGLLEDMLFLPYYRWNWAETYIHAAAIYFL